MTLKEENLHHLEVLPHNPLKPTQKHMHICQVLLVPLATYVSYKAMAYGE